jgi:hypothetical protein
MTQAMALSKKSDAGERFFVFAFFVALGLTSVLTIVGAGLAFSWTTVAVGVLYFVFLLFLADRLYAGWPQARLATQAWTGFQAVLAVIFAYFLTSVPGDAGLWALFLLYVTHLAFGTVLLGSRRVRGFLAERRGEAAPVVAPTPTPVAVPEGPMFVAAEGGGVELQAQSKQEVAGVAFVLRMVAWALLGLGGLDLAGFLVMVIWASGGWGLIPVGLLTVLAGFVLWTMSDEIAYLVTTRGSEVPHVTNALGDVSVLTYIVSILVALSVLLLIIGGSML